MLRSITFPSPFAWKEGKNSHNTPSHQADVTSRATGTTNPCFPPCRKGATTRGSKSRHNKQKRKQNNQPADPSSQPPSPQTQPHARVLLRALHLERLKTPREAQRELAGSSASAAAPPRRSAQLQPFPSRVSGDGTKGQGTCRGLSGLSAVLLRDLPGHSLYVESYSLCPQVKKLGPNLSDLSGFSGFPQRVPPFNSV